VDRDLVGSGERHIEAAGPAEENPVGCGHRFRVAVEERQVVRPGPSAQRKRVDGALDSGVGRVGNRDGQEEPFATRVDGEPVDTEGPVEARILEPDLAGPASGRNPEDRRPLHVGDVEGTGRVEDQTVDQRLAGMV
jgi:hypothetical protein